MQRPERRPDLPDFLAGTVWLVGAGPGDPGLLTALALHALAHADVVLHDALVADEILALANPAARLIDAGKRGRGRRVPQATTTARLIAAARAGQRVLRLKGGDPLVFGRGAEEAEALTAAGVPFRIVPGISAGIGGLAYAGIPLTHRAVNGAVTLVTGQASEVGDEPDWPALAASPLLVIYMGLGNLPQIAVQLLAAGRPATTPLAIVSAATTPRQQVIETTLGAASLEARRRAVTAPALIVIGEAVRRRAGLDWYRAAAAADAVPSLKRTGARS